MSLTHSAYQRTLSKRDSHARKRRCAVQCCNRPARPLQRSSGSTDRAAIALSRRCSLRSASSTEPPRLRLHNPESSSSIKPRVLVDPPRPTSNVTRHVCCADDSNGKDGYSIRSEGEVLPC